MHIFRKKPALNATGFSLMELMVGVALSGVVFLIFMALLGQTATFTSYFHGTATSVEGVSNAVSQFNAVFPQVVRIRSCGCRGLQNANLSNCTWSSATPWYNPVLNGGASNTANSGYGHLIFHGDFEAFYGGSNTQNTTQLLRDNISGYASALGGCEDYEGVPDSVKRGCKQQVRVYYRAPSRESGTTPSNAGMLTMLVGSDALTSITSASRPDGLIRIGYPGKDGSGGLGVTELSCGFDTSGGAASGLLFVLNFKVKARSTTLQDTSHSLYESWYPTVNVGNGYSGSSGARYDSGLFREVKLKFALRNLGTRGVHFWRSQSIRGCKMNGQSAARKEECCSLAISGALCIPCVASGSGGTADSCCSEKVSGGNCQ